MKRDWKGYINRQKYSECQLITAINAHYYLYGKPYCSQLSEEYENLVDLVKARHGAAISIEKAWKKLRIRPIAKYLSFHGVLSHDPSHIYSERIPHNDSVNWAKKVTWVKKNATLTRQAKSKAILPVEVSIWHPKIGFHSCLIVDYNKEVEYVRVTNFKPHLHGSGWISAAELRFYESRTQSGDDGLNSDGQQWLYRVFGKVQRRS